MAITSFTPSVTSPQTLGTPITWTCVATGGTSLEYEFLTELGSGGLQVAQGYGTSNTFAWTPPLREATPSASTSRTPLRAPISMTHWPRSPSPSRQGQPPSPSGMQPGPAAAGGTLNPQPVLYLEDANGNLETADNSSTVTLSLTIPNGATLGGTNKVTVNGGIATFTNLSVNMAGSYTLTPASSLLGITSPASNSFTVTAGTATQSSGILSPARPLPEGLSTPSRFSTSKTPTVI